MGKHVNSKRLVRHPPHNREHAQREFRGLVDARGQMVNAYYRQRQQMEASARDFERRHPEAASTMRRHQGRIADIPTDAAVLREIAERAVLLSGAIDRLGPH